MARTVSSFTVAADGKGDYLLNFEDEDGETIELTASFEQLDLIADAIGEALDADEEDALGVDEDEDEAVEE
jgi:hypothetical protein